MKNRIVKNSAYLIFAFLLVIFVFGNADIIQIERHFFNSDTLYLPSIYKDVFEYGNKFTDFNFNPAPNFFPDMGIYFGLMKLLNQDFVLVALVFAVLQLFIVFVLLNKLGSIVGVTKQQRNLGISLLVLFFLPAVYSNDFLFSFYFLINSYHLSSFILALWLFVLFQTIQQKRNAILYILIIILGVISDKSLLVNFVLPIFIVISTSLLFKIGDAYKNKIRGLIYTIIGTGLGLLFLKLNTKYGWISIAQTDVNLSWEGFVNSLSLFTSQTIKYLLQFSWVSLVLLIAIVSYVLSFINLIRTVKSKLDFNAVVLFLIINIVLFTPLLIGKITGLDSLRYNYHGVILLVFLFPYNLSEVIQRPFLFTKKATIVAISFILVILVLNLNFRGVKKVMNLYPQTTAWIDVFAIKYGLKNGLATYWKAKKHTMFSKKNVSIYSIHEDLKVYNHVANNTWCLKDRNNHGKQTVFNFFISDTDEMTANILTIFPEAKQIYLSESLFIIKTTNFAFDSDYNIVKL